MPLGRPRLEGISIEGHKGWEYGTQLEWTVCPVLGGRQTRKGRPWISKDGLPAFKREKKFAAATVPSLHQEVKTKTKALSRWDQSDDWSSRGSSLVIPLIVSSPPSLPQKQVLLRSICFEKRVSLNQFDMLLRVRGRHYSPKSSSGACFMLPYLSFEMAAKDVW